MLSSSDDITEMDSVQVLGPERNPNDVASVQKKSNIWTFLKRNAFVTITVTAVAVGK